MQRITRYPFPMVLRGIEAVRASGKTNMLDAPVVKDWPENGYRELPTG